MADQKYGMDVDEGPPDGLALGVAPERRLDGMDVDIAEHHLPHMEHKTIVSYSHTNAALQTFEKIRCLGSAAVQRRLLDDMLMERIGDPIDPLWAPRRNTLHLGLLRSGGLENMGFGSLSIRAKMTHVPSGLKSRIMRHQERDGPPEYAIQPIHRTLEYVESATWNARAYYLVPLNMAHGDGSWLLTTPIYKSVITRKGYVTPMGGGPMSDNVQDLDPHGLFHVETLINRGPRYKTLMEYGGVWPNILVEISPTVQGYSVMCISCSSQRGANLGPDQRVVWHSPYIGIPVTMMN